MKQIKYTKNILDKLKYSDVDITSILVAEFDAGVMVSSASSFNNNSAAGALARGVKSRTYVL